MKNVKKASFDKLVGIQRSTEYAHELLRALRGRDGLKANITRSELHYYWRRVTDPCPDSKIQIFFDLWLIWFIALRILIMGKYPIPRSVLNFPFSLFLNYIVQVRQEYGRGDQPVWRWAGAFVSRKSNDCVLNLSRNSNFNFARWSCWALPRTSCAWPARKRTSTPPWSWTPSTLEIEVT